MIGVRFNAGTGRFTAHGESGPVEIPSPTLGEASTDGERVAWQLKWLLDQDDCVMPDEDREALGEFLC